MLISFLLAKVVRREGKSQGTLSLRFRDGGDDLSSSEPVISAFCFPFGAEAVPAKERLASEEYTFTLTQGDGRRFQGFCRVVLPPAPKLGSKLRCPWVLCLVSEYPWSSFFFTVLQTVEQLLRMDDTLDTDQPQLPASCQACTFLEDLAFQLSPEPDPGAVIKVPLPNASRILGLSPSATLHARTSLYKDDWMELPVPIDCGNGKHNCGISLARLLWHLPVPAMLTLLSSMLQERRIIMTCRSRDTLTAAVQAAAALLYPFRYHHIFLPLLPKVLSDYLQAPMPFLVGLPDQMLGILKSMQGMDEVTLVDLDQGKVYSNWTPGNPVPSPDQRDASSQLPWRDELEAALTAAHRQLRSPTEYEESSPLIAAIMQEYFLKLFGDYRAYVHEDSPALNSRFAAALRASSSFSVTSGSNAVAAATAAAAGGGNSPASPAPTPRQSRVSIRGGLDDPYIKGHGYVFEHAAFVAHHRRSDTARAFLAAFRHSQMYEVWVQERLQLAARRYETDEPFEVRVVSYQERRIRSSAQHRQAAAVASAVAGVAPAGKLASMFKKHRRTGSGEAAFGVGVAASLLNKDPAMRRITTHPELQDPREEAPAVDPASFFSRDVDPDPFPDWALTDASAAPHSGPLLRHLPPSGSGGLSGRHNPPLGITSVPIGSSAGIAPPSPASPDLYPAASQPQGWGRGASIPSELLECLSDSSTLPSGAVVTAAQEDLRPGRSAAQQEPQALPSAPGGALPAAVSGAGAGSSGGGEGAGAPGRAGGLSLSLQSGKKHLEATKDAAKEMWSNVTHHWKGGAPPSQGGERVFTRSVSVSGGSVAGLEGPQKLAGGEGGRSGAGALAGGFLQRYLPNTAGGVMHSLLEGTKLKQPPAPVRPLNPVAAQAQEPAQTVVAKQHGAWDPFQLSSE